MESRAQQGWQQQGVGKDGTQPHACAVLCCCAVLLLCCLSRFPPSRPMPVSATIADWVGWMDFHSLDGLRKCLKINNRTGEEQEASPAS